MTAQTPDLEWTGRRPALADEMGWRGLTGDVKLTERIFAARPTGGDRP